MQVKWTICCFMIIFTASCMLGCSRQAKHQAQGYVEGRYTYMATSVSGVLKQMLVARGSQVKKGDTLAILEQQPESDLYNAAIENLKEAEAARDAIAANLQYAKVTYERYKVLVATKAIQQAQLDNARSVYEAMVAQLAQSNANVTSTAAELERTRWVTEQKTLIAPVDGIVFDTYYRPGEYTAANQAILSLLSPFDIKVVFYVNEPELGLLQLGNKVLVSCDQCEKSYSGKISFISPSAEYTPPVIYSNQTNEKLIYRIEAEFPPAIAYKMHPGQPVYVKYQVMNDE